MPRDPQKWSTLRARLRLVPPATSNCGRKRDEKLYSLVTYLFDPEVTNINSHKGYYNECIGAKDGCVWPFSCGKPQAPRVLGHAASCTYLPKNLFELANDMAAKQALGAKLGMGDEN